MSKGYAGQALPVEVRARRLEVAEKMLRRATMLAQHLVEHWLALARLLWEGESVVESAFSMIYTEITY